MIIEFSWPELMNIVLENIRFQQDGASFQFENDLLRQRILEPIISRNNDVNRLPSSYYLTPLDHFLSYVKS